MSIFWPPTESAQVDYETLRAAMLADTALITPAAVRFNRGGLAELILRPVSDPIFVATLHGARRAAWTPHDDPRLAALAASYRLLLAHAISQPENQPREVAP